MKKNKFITWILLGIALLFILIGLAFWPRPVAKKNKQKNTNKEFTLNDWTYQYELDSKEPEGLGLLYDLSKKSTKNVSIVDSNLTDYLKNKNQTFLFVGENFSLKESEMNDLFRKVKKGSQLIVSANEFDIKFRNRFLTNQSLGWIFNECTFIEDDNSDTFNLCSLYQMDTIAERIYLIEHEQIKTNQNTDYEEDEFEISEDFSEYNEYEAQNESDYYVYQEAYQTPIFIGFDYGQGTVLIHVNPTFFKNYQLVNPNGFAYSKNFLSYIEKDNELLWLQLASVSSEEMSKQNPTSQPLENKNSLLDFIFKNTALLIALILTIIGVLLFFIFGSKRYFPVLPYIEKKHNQSLAFADTVKQIYQKQKAPDRMLELMYRNFKTTINRHFYIDISKGDRADIVNKISEKSSLTKERVEEIFALFQDKKGKNITDAYLLKAAKNQRSFYQEAGIIHSAVNKRISKRKTEIRYALLFPFLALLIGILSILIGTLLLTMSNGFGIIGWPIGSILLIMAFLWLSRTYLDLSEKEWKINQWYGQVLLIDPSTILQIKPHKKTFIIYLKSNRKIQVHETWMSPFDHKKFHDSIQKFVIKQNV